jgi:hypothetical protein
MNISSNVKAFFWHVASGYAIRNGWDFETPLREFYAAHPEKEAALADQSYVSLGDIVVSEADVLFAYEGVVTANFEVFFTNLNNGWKEKDAKFTGEEVVLQSMHSGSSDYLFVKDVWELVNS